MTAPTYRSPHTPPWLLKFKFITNARKILHQVSESWGLGVVLMSSQTLGSRGCFRGSYLWKIYFDYIDNKLLDIVCTWWYLYALVKQEYHWRTKTTMSQQYKLDNTSLAQALSHYMGALTTIVTCTWLLWKSECMSSWLLSALRLLFLSSLASSMPPSLSLTQWCHLLIYHQVNIFASF